MVSAPRRRPANVTPGTPDRPAAELARPRLHELAAEYEIMRELGRGGAAVVYHARERELGREVAIKVVHPSHIADPDAVARLAREARLVAQLRHPNLVTLFGTRRLADGSLALIMQYVPGRTLKGAIREDGPLPIAMVESVLREVALALHYAHQRHGIVHRDIKPENIYLDTEGGRTLLSDFGIARTTESESSLTLAGTALGTPAYMSPEQIDGLTLDGRSDLYSLGLVAYEMLTGQQPWAGNNLYTIIYRQKHEDLPPLREFRGDIPAHMQRAIDGLLRKDRGQRWSDAAQFISELRPASASGGIAAPVMTYRPSARAEPAAQVPDDSPTIVYRPHEDAATHSAESIPVVVAAVPAAAAAETASDVTADTAAASDESAPVVRFFFDAADDEPAATVPVALPRRKRRLPALLGLALFLTLAAAMVPLIGEGEPSSSEAPDAAPVREPFVAPGVPGAPARLVVLTDSQAGYVGEPLVLPVGVLVEDADGRPVAGTAVELKVTAGSGSVAPALAVSDSRGLAMTRWTLGDTPGPNELSAHLRGAPESAVVFRATGVAGPVARLVAESGGDQTASSGGVLADPVVVRVEDARGNPVIGARVEFSIRAGGGSVLPTTARTDSAGLARALWTIGADQASATLRATLAQSDLHIDFAARARPRLSAQSRLVAGGTHTCVLAATGGVACWGSSDSGQLGSAPPFARLAAGVSHSCALDRDGVAHCWGVNSAGQLGVGDQNDRAVPAPVRSVESLVAITAGLAHTCALAADGRAYCWGDGSSGQIGNGVATDQSSPVRVTTEQTFASLSAGWRHTCGLTTRNVVYCWGTNSDGQLGDGTITNRGMPTRVVGDMQFAVISTGAAHSCAVTVEGEAYCWGQNSGGQLGSGNRTDSPRPVRVQTDVPFISTVAGAVHTCALSRAGEAYCWGRNNFGQLGNDSTADSPIPVAVAGRIRFTFLSAGGSHSCGRTGAGEYYCWGYNVEGQLGDGTRVNRSQPVRVRAANR